LEQGSRLSAVRIAQTYAIASVIDLNKGFHEEDLYKKLTWLDQNQASIEDQIFNKQFFDKRPHLLYDVNSSSLGGDIIGIRKKGKNRSLWDDDLLAMGHQ